MKIFNAIGWSFLLKSGSVFFQCSTNMNYISSDFNAICAEMDFCPNRTFYREN